MSMYANTSPFGSAIVFFWASKASRSICSGGAVAAACDRYIAVPRPIRL